MWSSEFYFNNATWLLIMGHIYNKIKQYRFEILLVSSVKKKVGVKLFKMSLTAKNGKQNLQGNSSFGLKRFTLTGYSWSVILHMIALVHSPLFISVSYFLSTITNRVGKNPCFLTIIRLGKKTWVLLGFL